MKTKNKKQKKYKKTVMDAYNLLVDYRKNLEEHGRTDDAHRVEDAYQQLWCECLNEPAPW